MSKRLIVTGEHHKVMYDPLWNEYTVVQLKNATFMNTYHTDDKQDAIDTMKYADNKEKCKNNV